MVGNISYCVNNHVLCYYLPKEVKMIDVTLFDLECVRMGLPPMSGTPQEIFEMIVNSKPSQKRSINRKIKKLAKSQIKNQFSRSHNVHTRNHMRVAINVSNTGKRTKVRHSLNLSLIHI